MPEVPQVEPGFIWARADQKTIDRRVGVGANAAMDRLWQEVSRRWTWRKSPPSEAMPTDDPNTELLRRGRLIRDAIEHDQRLAPDVAMQENRCVRALMQALLRLHNCTNGSWAYEVRRKRLLALKELEKPQVTRALDQLLSVGREWADENRRVMEFPSASRDLKNRLSIENHVLVNLLGSVDKFRNAVAAAVRMASMAWQPADEGILEDVGKRGRPKHFMDRIARDLADAGIPNAKIAELLFPLDRKGETESGSRPEDRRIWKVKKRRQRRGTQMKSV